MCIIIVDGFPRSVRVSVLCACAHRYEQHVLCCLDFAAAGLSSETTLSAKATSALESRSNSPSSGD